MAWLWKLGVQHFRSIVLGQSHVRSADHSTVAPVNEKAHVVLTCHVTARLFRGREIQVLSVCT